MRTRRSDEFRTWFVVLIILRKERRVQLLAAERFSEPGNDIQDRFVHPGASYVGPINES